MNLDLKKIQAQAKAELEAEEHREAVNRYKESLRKQKWYHKLFPFKITIQRREKL